MLKGAGAVGGGALFRAISQRYEHGSTLVTTNRIFKRWPEIFNNGITLTTALLDRLLHHCERIFFTAGGMRYAGQASSPKVRLFVL